LDSEREAIPDVPAIYFVRPTAENIQRIAEDCKNKLYGSMHLNFISKLERRLMEDLARLVIDAGQFQIISKIFDQHLDFVTLEPRLFTLNHKNSYVAYNGNQSEASINETMKSITNGVFSMLATLEAMPIIRAPPNGPSEMVARQLNEQLATAWANGTGAAFGSGSTISSRPLVVLLDRAVDFGSILQHTCTYQAILHDVLNYRMNRVNISEDGANRTYDLEVENDAFWKKNAPLAFPQAIEDNSNELNKIKDLEKEVRSRTTASDQSGEDQAASGLLATVDSLPELLERKKKVESHSSILQAAMSVIAARQLPVFFDAETSDRFDKDKLIELMGSSSKGNISDKLRLLAVLSLNAEPSDTPLLQELEDVMKGADMDTDVQDQIVKGLAAIKHMKQIRQFQSPPPKQAESSSSNLSGGRLGSWVQSKTAGILGQVQSLLTRSDENYVTRVIDNLCEFKVGTEDDTFLTLDPRRSKTGLGKNDVKTGGRTPHREVIVFMIGGGSYSEYQRIQEYVTEHPEKSITYGCTELINGESFLKQVGTI